MVKRTPPLVGCLNAVQAMSQMNLSLALQRTSQLVYAGWLHASTDATHVAALHVVHMDIHSVHL